MSTETFDATDEWDRMGKAFKSGAILKAGRQELERYLFALAVVQVQAGHNQQRAAQMGETIRYLLARIDSMESERRAMKIATAALLISMIAALLAAIDVAAALGYLKAWAAL